MKFIKLLANWSRRPPDLPVLHVTYTQVVELVGRPRDGESVKVRCDCDRLLIPVVTESIKALWEPDYRSLGMSAFAQVEYTRIGPWTFHFVDRSEP